MIQTNHVDLRWSYEENTFLNPIQIDICQRKADGESLNSLMEKFQFGKSTIYSILTHTIEGNIWGNDKGGIIGFLGDIESRILVKKVKDNVENLNCLKTIDVMQVAINLKNERYSRTVFLAQKLSSAENKGKTFKELIYRLTPFVPSKSWVLDFANRNEIPIKSSITIEELRRKFCNYSNVNSFYSKNKNELLSIHPRLLCNADEASHASSRKFKILAGSDFSKCVTSQTGQEPHFTTMYCFNASGEKMNPFIILPRIKNVPESMNYDFQAVFASQNSGWMTARLFSVWCVFFVSWISRIRMELPNNCKNQTAILIVDNHPSRMNSTAIEFFISHNTKIITLPSHCSHVLQPFDVAVAASVKAKITRSRLIELTPRFAGDFTSKQSNLRYSIVYAIVSSWSEISIDTILKGWEKSGIFPFNPEKGTKNELTNQNVIQANQRNAFSISNQDLSDPSIRLQIAQKNFGIISVPNFQSIPKPSYAQMYNEMKLSLDLNKGKLLSAVPNIYIETALNTWKKVFGQ